MLQKDIAYTYYQQNEGSNRIGGRIYMERRGFNLMNVKLTVKQVLYPLMFILGLAVTVSNSWGDNLPTNGMDQQILYWSGTTYTGSNATWGDPSSIPGLQGAPGTNGVDGVNGADGAAGTNGSNGTNGAKGKDGSNGRDGVNGKNLEAPTIDPRLDVEVREFDSRHWSMSSYASFALQTGTARYVVGQKLTLKLGKSFEEKQREILEKKLLKMMDNSVLLPVN